MIRIIKYCIYLAKRELLEDLLAETEYLIGTFSKQDHENMFICGRLDSYRKYKLSILARIERLEHEEGRKKEKP